MVTTKPLLLRSAPPQELRPLAQLLAEGASRVFSGDGAQLFPPGARLSALECALEASRRDPAPHGAALRSCKRTLPSLLSALRVSAATAPERRRREFAGGAELIFRDFSRMTDEAQGAAVAALKLVAALASADGREEARSACGSSHKSLSLSLSQIPRSGLCVICFKCFQAPLQTDAELWCACNSVLAGARRWRAQKGF